MHCEHTAQCSTRYVALQACAPLNVRRGRELSSSDRSFPDKVLYMINPMAMRWCRLYRGTPAELAIEPAIAALGIPYRTQFPLFLFGKLRYFPDFLLPTRGLVIEIDDRSHTEARKRIEDAERSAELKRVYGWDVVRISNADAIADPEGALRSALASAPPAAGPELPLASALPASPGHAKTPKRGERSPEGRGRKRFGA